MRGKRNRLTEDAAYTVNRTVLSILIESGQLRFRSVFAPRFLRGVG